MARSPSRVDVIGLLRRDAEVLHLDEIAAARDLTQAANEAQAAGAGAAAAADAARGSSTAATGAANNALSLAHGAQQSAGQAQSLANVANQSAGAAQASADNAIARLAAVGRTACFTAGQTTGTQASTFWANVPGCTISTDFLGLPVLIDFSARLDNVGSTGGRAIEIPHSLRVLVNGAAVFERTVQAETSTQHASGAIVLGAVGAATLQLQAIAHAAPGGPASVNGGTLAAKRIGLAR